MHARQILQAAMLLAPLVMGAEVDTCKGYDDVVYCGCGTKAGDIDGEYWIAPQNHRVQATLDACNIAGGDTCTNAGVSYCYPYDPTANSQEYAETWAGFCNQVDSESHYGTCGQVEYGYDATV